jgi:hypothetical protein
MKFQSESIKDALREMIRDSDFEVRIYAKEALKNLELRKSYK